MPLTTIPHDLLPDILAHVRDGRFARCLAGITGFAGLISFIEVAQQHYTGSFGQKIMYSPLLCCMALAVTGFAAALAPNVARPWLAGASVLLVMDGAVGFAFHVRGVARKPGGWRRNLMTNIVMGPPILAPLVLTIAGFIGLIATRLMPEEAVIGLTPDTLDFLRRLLAAAAAVYAALNGCEALYSHYKTRFDRRPQWTPIVLAPVLTLAGGLAALSPDRFAAPLAIVSCVAICAGVAGFGFHLAGVKRRPGGWRQLSYNLVYGPPIFAPLLFAATGGLGLLAAELGALP